MKTTVVGSYPKIPNRPRPAKHRMAIARLQEGKIAAEEMKEIENEVTVEVIQELVGAGLDMINDGMIRWEDSQTPFARGLEGFEIGGLIRYFDTNTYYRQPIAVAPIRFKQPITVDDFQFAKTKSTKPIKPLVTGPYTLARLSENRHYAKISDFATDLARALREEVLALEAAGAEMIQIDEPAILRYPQDAGLFADAIRTLVQGVKCPILLQTYFADATPLWPVMTALPVSWLGLDLATNPITWKVINGWQGGLCLGLVDARNTRMEDFKSLRPKVEKLLSSYGNERLMLSPSAGLEFLPRERAEEKLKRMVAFAKEFEEGSPADDGKIP
jgi:5-methyltetrahydropteroyltriglutamate--homocysteine methyltransferase